MSSRNLRRGFFATVFSGLLAANLSPLLAARTAEEPPTGRIAGRVGTFPNAEGLAPIRVQSVELFTNDAPRPTAVATPSATGEFTFEGVPPGRILLHPVLVDSRGLLASNPSALRAPAIVRSGQTLKVDLFGKGRPLTGTIKLPEHIRPETCRVELSYPAPPFRSTRLDGARPSPPHHAHALLTMKKLTAPVAADGRFRIEGVRAGNYYLSVSGGIGGKPVRILPDRRGLEPDQLPERVTIWLMSDEESDRPYNLGTSAWIDR